MLRNIFVLNLLITCGSLFAQSNWCGTVTTDAFYKSYAAKDRSNYQSYLSNRDGIRWIPVRYHLVAKADHTGSVNLRDVFQAHCELNGYFNPLNIGFFIEGLDTIFDTQLWEYQNSSLGWDAFDLYNYSNVCNVYVNGNLPGLCGFATLPGSSSGGVFLNKSCISTGSTTYPHEMGHFLGLVHTFETIGGIEYVNGSNCLFAGDRFCDTPADFLETRTACPYTGDQTDPHGDLYRTVIDPTLFMSYFYDNCVNRFSPMQQAEMHRVLSQERSYLFTIAPPGLETPPAVQFIYPLDGETSINSNKTTFTWHPVVGAHFYNLKIQSSSSSAVLCDTMITDTTFIFDLTAGKKYRFFVKAISLGSACGSDAPYQNIETSTIKTNVMVKSPSCLGGADGMAVVTPINGNPPYAFQWEDGTQDSIIYGLRSGNYFVTVVDNDGMESNTLVTVGSPTPVKVNFNIGSNSILALATGGVIPYSFLWSNGVNGQYNNNLSYGSYSVTVTDAKGCVSVNSVLFNSISDEAQPSLSIKIFPNPAFGTSSVKLQIELSERSEGVVSVLNLNGEVIYQQNINLSAGKHQLPLFIGTLSSGVYLVRFQSVTAIKTERLSVIR